jgi:spermidine synthase
MNDRRAGAAPPHPAHRHPWHDRAPFLLYALTGFTGLLAEQGFEKYIALLVGATASASAVVLFTYFLGFALGGVAAGRLIKSRRIARPLLVYGVIELLVGISCVAFSYSFHSLIETLAPLQYLFGGAALRYQARFLCGCILVLPTAALMGASFPLIASALDGGDPAGKKRWTQIYTANLVGALLAAGTAPLILMPLLGLRGCLWLCFAITVLVCAATMALRPAPLRGPASRETAGKPHGVQAIRLLLAASFASGAVFFALEVIWTHLVGVVIGCSIYAFSWMLAAVLLGLLIGASLVNRSQRRDRAISPALLFQGSALLLLLQLLLWDQAPMFFRITPPAVFQESFYFSELYKLAVTCLLLVPASTVLGLIYPKLLASPQLEGEDNSHLSGYLSAANSLGCLTGALLSVFVLIPRLGSELSLKAIILVLVAFWLLFLRHERPLPRRLRLAAATALCAAAILVSCHWNWGTLTAGTGNYFGQKPAKASPQASGVTSFRSFGFRDEGVQGGLTTVVNDTIRAGHDTSTIHTLYTNGKFEGDDNPGGQMNAQFGFSAIPSLFVNHFDRALLIGLGTGHGAAALKHLGYRDIDIAEFAPGIVAAARQSFAHLNEGILDDPHAHLFLEDGRNVLLTSRQRAYDLITIEVTSVWFAGATNLYSQEFYELARKRLRPDGVLQQWVQLHHIGPREVACALATAHAVFPYVGLWLYGTQGMMVASNRPLVLDEALRPELDRRFRSASLADELYGSELVSPDGLSRLMNDFHPVINTDNNRWLEYSTPRYQSSAFDWFQHNVQAFSRYKAAGVAALER